jgi:hypothetical protein
MTRTGKITLLFGICLIVATAGVWLWWMTRQPQGLDRTTTEYAWQKTVVTVDGQEYTVEHRQFGEGIRVEDKPYWKQPAKTPQEAAVAELTCLRTGGTFEDYLRLYADPAQRRKFIASTGGEDEFVKSNRSMRQALLLGEVRYKELCIVAVKAAVDDSPDPWVTFGLCFINKNGHYLSQEKPQTPLMIWLSQNDYLVKYP